jgi:phosphatidylglycerol---prolipoprotein diacylglyceryl transferase
LVRHHVPAGLRRRLHACGPAKPGSTWKPQDVDDLIFFAMLGVILGGRIGYVLFYGLEFWKKDSLYPFKIWDGGMSFHGGMLGVIAACSLFA